MIYNAKAILGYPVLQNGEKIGEIDDFLIDLDRPRVEAVEVAAQKDQKDLKNMAFPASQVEVADVFKRVAKIKDGTIPLQAHPGGNTIRLKDVIGLPIEREGKVLGRIVDILLGKNGMSLLWVALEREDQKQKADVLVDPQELSIRTGRDDAAETRLRQSDLDRKPAYYH